MVSNQWVTLPTATPWCSFILLPVRGKIQGKSGWRAAYNCDDCKERCDELELQGGFIFFGLDKDPRPVQSFQKMWVFNPMSFRKNWAAASQKLEMRSFHCCGPKQLCLAEHCCLFRYRQLNSGGFLFFVFFFLNPLFFFSKVLFKMHLCLPVWKQIGSVIKCAMFWLKLF